MQLKLWQRRIGGEAFICAAARSLLGVRAEVAKHLAEIKLDQAFDGLVVG